MELDNIPLMNEFVVTMIGNGSDGITFNPSGGYPDYYITVLYIDPLTGDEPLLSDYNLNESNNFKFDDGVYKFVVRDIKGSLYIFEPITLPFTGILDENSDLVKKEINDSPTLPIFKLGPPIINYGNYACDLSITLINEFQVTSYGVTDPSYIGTGLLCIDITGGTASPADYTVIIYDQGPPLTRIITTGFTSDGTYCFELPNGVCYYWETIDNITDCFYTGITCIPEIILTCDTTTYVNPSCGRCNGSITSAIVHGYGPFIFYLYSGSTTINSPTIPPTLDPGGQVSYTFTGICEGTWTTVITDVGTNITITCDTVTLIGSNNLTLSATTTPENCNNSGGTITVTPLNGIPPYTYTLNGGTPTTSNHFVGLTAGIYTINVIDSAGCTGTTIVTLVRDGNLTVTASTTPENCNYSSGGTITVTPLGGTPLYTYSLNNGTPTTTNHFVGLTVGTYTINVTDSAGCTGTVTVVIDPPVVLSSSTTPENCQYSSGGTITVFGTTGNPPYQYSLNGGPLTNIGYFTGLTNGTYSILVIDASGCSATTTTVIDPPIKISGFTISDCINISGGSISVIGIGGNPPYEYSLNGGVYTNIGYFSGLTAGNYNITVVDISGCSATTAVTLNPPLSVSAITLTAITCSGYSTADLTLIPLGGNPPYRYLWSPINVNTQTVHSGNYVTSPGTYSYSGTVIDNFGCSATTVVTFTIISADTPSLSILSAGTLSCDNSTYVTLSAVTTGPYTVGPNWSNGQNGVFVITANTPGSYSYYVSNGDCIYSSTTVILDYPYVPPPLIGYDATLCVCSSTSVRLINNGYTYHDILWNNGSSANTISVSSCTPTGYTFYLTAKDQYGCPVTSNTVTIRFTDLAIDFYKNDSVCLDCGICIDGYAEIIVLSGTPPYTYFWTGATNNSNVLNNAQPGHYVVTVVDGAGCTKTLQFDISATTITDCTYEPVRDGNGNIILNPDGTISFYNPNINPIVITNYSPSQDCCLSNSTIDLPLQYCDCKCYWKRPTCFSGETRIDKIILGGDGNNGVQLISDTPKNDQSIVCQYQASFDFLFNFDCQKLYDCVQNNYSGSVLTFLSGLSAYATVEVVSGTSFVTAQTEKIWSFDINKQPTGVYFAGQSNFCQLINDIIYDGLGTNCTALTQTTFAVIWQHASFKIYDSLSGQTVKLGLILEGFNCEYNILLDNIKIEEVCVITTENLVTLDNGSVGTNGACFGFQLDKVIDNKKSWVYNDSFYQRDWFHLKYRDTSYPDYDERLDINTKEIDLNISASRAINYDIYCYALSQNCYTFSGCGNPNLILQNQFSGMGLWDRLDPSSYSGSMVSYFISPLTAGQQYDIHFTVDVIDNSGMHLPPGFLTNLVIGFMSGNTTYILLDAITGVTNTGITTYNYTFMLNGPIINSNKFFIRLVNGFAYRTYYVNTSDISISLHCNPSNINPNNFITMNSGMTYDQFVQMMQNQLIDVKDRQSISAYPLLRYMYEKYLGLCGVSVSGSSNCNVQSNQYNYSSLNNFIGLIGGYWADLIEQFVPATTIWGGGGSVGGGGGSATSRSYSNNMFDQPKFEYRNFSIGYCDSEYCFEGNSNRPSYSAACYVNTTPTAFSALSSSIATSINNGVIGNTIQLCASQSMLPCCNTTPLSCFMSAEFGFNFNEGNVTKSGSTVMINNLNSLPTPSQYLNMIYSGLYDLGYTNAYPSGILEWSKPSNTGCSDPINLIPYINVKYSCLTATTIANCNSTILYQTLFTGFTSTYHRPVFAPIITDLGTKMYGVGGGTAIGGSGGQYGDGYIWTYSINTGTFGILKDFNFTVDGVSRPLRVIKSSVDGFLYGVSLGAYFNATPINPTLFKIDPNNPTNFSVVYTFFNNLTASPLGTPSIIGNMIQHSNNKIYFGGAYSGRWGIYEFNVSTQTLTPLNLFTDLYSSTYINYGPRYTAIYLTEDTFSGYIYGTTTTGGQYGFGKIFRFNPNNPIGTYFVVHDFNGTLNGSSSTGVIWPSGPVLRANSTTFYGLVADERSPASAIDRPYLDGIYTFNDNPTTNPNNQVTVTKLTNFSNNTLSFISSPCWYTRHPNGNLILKNNILYGIADSGYVNPYTTGAIFQYNIGTNDLTGVHIFAGGNNGGVSAVPVNTNGPWLAENVYDNKIYSTTNGGGTNEYGTIYRFSYSPPVTSASSGITVHECTILGSLVNLTSYQLQKVLVTYSSDTYVSGTSISGISCTDYCASYLDNPGVEVIVEDLTNLITNPCTDPPIVDQCNIVFAYHIDNDVWFNGSVTVTYPFNPTNSISNGGAVLVTQTNAA